MGSVKIWQDSMRLEFVHAHDSRLGTEGDGRRQRPADIETSIDGAGRSRNMLTRHGSV
jgi:hypothetical protein